MRLGRREREALHNAAERSRVVPLPDENLPAVDLPSDAAVYAVELRRLLMEAIDKLPPMFQEVVRPRSGSLSRHSGSLGARSTSTRSGNANARSSGGRSPPTQRRHPKTAIVSQKVSPRPSLAAIRAPENHPSAAPVPTLSRIQRAERYGSPAGWPPKRGFTVRGVPELLTFLLTFGAALGRFVAVSDRF